MTVKGTLEKISDLLWPEVFFFKIQLSFGRFIFLFQYLNEEAVVPCFWYLENVEVSESFDNFAPPFDVTCCRSAVLSTAMPGEDFSVVGKFPEERREFWERRSERYGSDGTGTLLA